MASLWLEWLTWLEGEQRPLPFLKPLGSLRVSPCSKLLDRPRRSFARGAWTRGLCQNYPWLILSEIGRVRAPIYHMNLRLCPREYHVLAAQNWDQGSTDA
ncbi:hypothetical protein VNO77_44323 [Canavalia gladiata]|uniref:Uncharacterized protein n=1 Tax=Canavalia gladiata TaxID=3824 RepID=A0AAN9JVT0_CANGL